MALQTLGKKYKCFLKQFILFSLKFSSLPVNFHRIKFLAIAVDFSIEVYAWAPKPYHKFMAFKVS